MRIIKHLQIILILFLVNTITTNCTNNNKAALEEIINRDYNARKESLDAKMPLFNKELTEQQRQALEFLYAYMPLPDLVDYSTDFYLEQVDLAIKAKNEMPWGATIPKREWYHFVLPIRVNNENLDSCRKVFYNELKPRIAHLSMKEAVLEINHWCHEKVTYRPTDSRTSSPLASVKTAFGRCGEESTFTVAAMRAMGIPARQVYTPRWAHTDDNHAWVEAFVDGEWCFLGACEPEPVLNLGWFNAPASRGLLMHTKVFGRYTGPEEVMNTNPCYTEINVTQNYAPVSTINVKVIDKNNNPIEGIEVCFKIYNYAEFYTAARKKTDKRGTVSLTTGLGDILVWATNGENFGFTKCSVGKDKKIVLKMDREIGETFSADLDIIPPKESNNMPIVEKSAAEICKKRLIEEDSIRRAYEQTFPSATDIEKWINKNRIKIKSSTAIDLITKSRGNYAVIMEFIKNNPKRNKEVTNLLSNVSEKDLRDVTLDVLQDHLLNSLNNNYPDNIFYPYVMNPRVSNELLTPYKGFFNEVISKIMREKMLNNPTIWIDFCKKEIKIDREWNPQSLCMHPKGVWQMRRTDTHSRDIFFVAGARSLGIAARIDEVTGKTQYWKDNMWQEVKWNIYENPANIPQGTLKATFNKTNSIDNPKYYSHFTLSLIKEGLPKLQNYPEDATWSSLLKDGERVDIGYYLLTTGARMANGSVLAQLQFINVTTEETTLTSLNMRKSTDNVEVIGNFNSENLYTTLNDNKECSILSTTGRGYYIIGLIEPGTEPTNHALHDISAYKEEFEKWGRSIILLFSSKADATHWNATSNEFNSLPKNINFGIDKDNIIAKEIIDNLKLDNSTSRPIFIIADTFNRVVYIQQGYTIGMGEQLLKIINKL